MHRLRPLSRLDALLWTLGVSFGLAGVLTVLSWLGARGLSAAALIEAAMFAGAAAVLSRSSASTRDRIGLGADPAPLLLVGLVLGAALHGPADFLASILDHAFPLAPPDALERVARLRPDAVWERAALLGLGGILVPGIEEVFFRGVLFGRLAAGTGVGKAALTSGVLFTVSHLEPRLWAPLGLVALALSVLRAMSAGIVPCVLLHASFNVTTLLVSFLDVPALERGSVPSLALALGGACLSGLLLTWVGVRSLGRRGG